MPDNRRTRLDDPLRYPQLVEFPADLPPGGMALDHTPGLNPVNVVSRQEDPARPGVKLDQSSPAAWSAPDYVNKGDDAYRSPLETIPQGLGAIGSAIGNGVSDLGSMLGRGLNAITPSQGSIDNIAMRLQNAHAIGTGQLPMYMQMQAAQQQYGQANELMQMKRAQTAQQLTQMQMQKQQKDEDQALGIWKDPHMPLSMKKKVSEQLKSQGNVLAGNLARMGDEQLIAEMETLQQHLPAGKLGELINVMRQPNADLAPVEQWVNFARDRKKAFGEAQMKSERFAGLLQKYQNGDMDINGPEYDEFKQHVMEREKRQQEAAEMDLKLQTMGISKRKAEQELAANSVMPQYGPEVNLPGGNVQRDKYDPQTGNLTQVMGNKPPASVTNVNMKQESAFEGELGKENAKGIKDTQAKARDAAVSIGTIHQARRLLDSGVITGVGAEYRTKFGQALQEVGFQKSNDKIANTQAFTALMAANVGQMIKQFGAGTGLSDADREFATKMAGGDITIDEKSIRKIIDLNENASRNVIKLHNKSVKGIKSMIPLEVDEPPEYTKSNIQSSNQEFIETRITKDGRRLGKTKDGKIVEIK